MRSSSHSHQLPYYDDDDAGDKSKRPKSHHHHHLSNSAFPSRLTLYLFSSFCLLIAISSVAFSFYAGKKPAKVVTVYRCGRAEDALRTHRSRAAGVEADARPKVVGVVGVQTGFGSGGIERRVALRNTWFPRDPDGLASLEHSTGLTFRFVIGRTKDPQKMAELQKEVDLYHDFMFIDIEEDYSNLPQKSLAFFRAAFDLFDADFYVKADDDIYLRPDRLATLLSKDRSHHMTYIGCMKKGPVITDPKMKWYESKGDLIGSEYFLHAHGPIYALSSNVVAALASSKNDSLRMFSNEDVTIGSWMLSMNVNYEDNKEICSSTCTDASIAVWDIPCSGLCNASKKIKELHNNTICSKSPTLPAEDEED
ncbi:hypothetical protein LUZ60_009565 [Juncus effusus]|nr:hypothetical protein LUZ60_009565 [Juncus effusus]